MEKTRGHKHWESLLERASSRQGDKEEYNTHVKIYKSCLYATNDNKRDRGRDYIIFPKMQGLSHIIPENRKSLDQRSLGLNTRLVRRQGTLVFSNTLEYFG